MTAYRYTLTRNLFDVFGARGRGRLCWVMLNPSTADDFTDDPTVRRIAQFTRSHNYSSLEIVNMFAARTTDPYQLLGMDDPVGPDNDTHILEAFNRADDVVFAWGAWLAVHRHRLPRGWPPLPDVATHAAQCGHVPLCLGTTGRGEPRHPLYIPKITRLRPYCGAVLGANGQGDVRP